MGSRRPAEWRLPNTKQMAAERARELLAGPPAAAQADDTTSAPATARPRRIRDARLHVIRVECLRCFRIVEITRHDAQLLFGVDATLSVIGSKLLSDGCQARTGSRDDDGCWPDVRA